MIADPLPADSRIGAGEDVKTQLEPVAETVGDFERFVQLVSVGYWPSRTDLAALESEVAVELEHGGSGRNKVGTVDLNFITALGVKKSEGAAAMATAGGFT